MSTPHAGNHVTTHASTGYDDLETIVNSQLATMNNNTIKGNASGGSATPSDLTVLPTACMPALTSDVTTPGGSLVTTIANGAVTAVKMVNSGVFTGDATTTFPALTIGNGAITDAKTTGVFTLAAGTRAFTGDQSMGSHKLTNVTDPASAQDAATKNYVDLAVAAISAKNDAQVATNVLLPGTYVYNNGSSGIGATLTAPAAAVLTIDGYLVALNDRVLVKNEAAAANNGIYYVSTLGTVLVKTVLTRSLDFDQPGDGINGALVYVINGTLGANTMWSCTTNGTITFGATAINWFQFQGATYTADESTLTLTGTVFSEKDGGTTLAKMANLATARIIGRNTAGTGVPESLSTLPTGCMPALTGDVTNSAGSLATTIANDAVTTVKILNANVTAAKLVNAGVHTGDAIGTFPAVTFAAQAFAYMMMRVCRGA